MNKLFAIFTFVFFSCFSVVFAVDSDGVWTLAENVRPGVFGGDEGLSGEYRFGNDVYFDNPIKSDNNLNKIERNLRLLSRG